MLHNMGHKKKSKIMKTANWLMEWEYQNKVLGAVIWKRNKLKNLTLTSKFDEKEATRRQSDKQQDGWVR